MKRQSDASSNGEVIPHKYFARRRTRFSAACLVDARKSLANLLVSNTIAAAHVTSKPGGLRERRHLRENAEEWQYFTWKRPHNGIFHGGKARTADFHGVMSGLSRERLVINAGSRSARQAVMLVW